MMSAVIPRKACFATVLVVSLLASCAAPATIQPTAQVVEFGIVHLVGPFERHADPNTAVGYTSSGPGRSTFEKRTTDIPAAQGCSFGLGYQVRGVPAGQTVTVEEIVRHPPISRPDGTVIREERTKDRWSPDDGVVDRKFLYILREPYEVVPGDWTLAVAVDGKVEFEKHFNLVPPK